MKNGNKFAPVMTTLTGPSITGPSITGPSITGPSITIGAPNIRIQLNGLVKATEQARADPNKMANLERTVANLKARLSNGSEAKKALNASLAISGANWFIATQAHQTCRTSQSFYRLKKRRRASCLVHKWHD